MSDEAEQPAVLSELREGVGIITLNRPDKLNAWNSAMGTLYFDTLDAMAADPAVRAVLVLGAGRGFCSGADMSALGNLSARGEITKRDGRPYWYAMGVGKPIVAAVHGACYGVGLQQALCCDIRFAAHGARFCVPYVKRGLIAELGLSWQLSRFIGAGRTTDMLLSARVVAAEEALAIGLVNQLAAPDDLFDRAFAYCRTIAAENSPWAMRTVKQQIYQDLMTASMKEPFAEADRLLGEAVAGPDMKEGIAAFREKRPLAFPPLSPDLARLDPFD
ncbi:enoyl-CoA hydratase/isomerase family protein [Novosphingobium sp. G106]|uniref:enoyl-CoA hydratase-related protein n=1 Tax=Novosphingobium sp. G106 TaxID=2849500 RepID=UPI001C2D45F2|nr:enoyl-CoA hydratase-related protein [Novosphingobium sp. G106]MBV1691261.1 enoyl-CoA hydratase/isomerase family protein [Novosphingobium sp. G106]